MKTEVVRFLPIEESDKTGAAEFAGEFFSRDEMTESAYLRRLTAIADGRAFVVLRNGRVVALSTLANMDEIIGDRIALDKALIDSSLGKRGLECVLQPLAAVYPVLYREVGHRWTMLEVERVDLAQSDAIFQKFGFRASGSDSRMLELPIADIKDCARELLPMVGKQLQWTQGDLGELKIMTQRPGPMFRECNRNAFRYLAKHGGPLPSSFTNELLAGFEADRLAARFCPA